MVKERREKVAKGDWVSDRRDGESAVVHSFLDGCMCEEQAMQKIRNRKQNESAERELEKEARAEKLLEASLAPAGSRSRICGESEIMESSGKKRTTSSSSSSSYPSMDGIVAGYLASMSGSPDTRRRWKEIEASDAAAQQQEAENRREELAVRKLEVELRQQDMESNQELRQQELKAIQKTQKQTLELVAKFMDELG